MDEGFDDPQLKAAVGRVWGCDCAPESLRSKVESICCHGHGSDEGQQSGAGSGGKWRGFAIAASILLVAGIVTWLPWGGSSVQGGATLPHDVVLSMVQTHDRCCRAHNHFLLRGVGQNDFFAIGRKLSSDLKMPVLSTSLEQWDFEGTGRWHFAGAGKCPVWGHASAHLLYRDGAQTLSIFSIPAADFSIAGHDGNYYASYGTHQLAAFVKNGGLYCVVENSPSGAISAGQTRWICNQLRDSFAQSAISFTDPPRDTALASASH